MDKYISVKMVQAEPMTLREYNKQSKKRITYLDEDADGYKLFYNDGYISWCPEDIFKKSYILVDSKDVDAISQGMVDSFINTLEVSTIGDRTTMVMAHLINGWTIVETSSCVDPQNYDEGIGANECVEKIKDRIWSNLGFLLQTALKGFNCNGE